MIAPRTSAQKLSTVRFTTADGLPANQIYHSIQDKNGYLWIATPKGVARYNGYSYKTFTVKDGLPSNDVWKLFEDSRGRIWLYSHAPKIGYIEHDRYYSIPLPEQQDVLRPKEIMDVNGTVLVHYFSNNKPQLAVFGDYIAGNITSSQLAKQWKVQMLALGRSYIWDVTLDNRILQYLPARSSNTPYKSCSINFDILQRLNGYSNLIPFTNYLYFYTASTGKLNVFDINTCSFSSIDLTGEDLLLAGRSGKIFLAITNKNIYQIKGTKLVQFQKIGDITEDQVNWYFVDAFQNKWISTGSSGLLLQKPGFNWRRSLQKNNALQNSIYKGTIDGKTYWWNKIKSELQVFNNEKLQRTFPLPGHGILTGITQCQNDIVVSTSLSAYRISETGNIRLLADANTKVTHTNDMVHDSANTAILKENYKSRFGPACLLYTTSDSVVLFLSPLGSYTTTLRKGEVSIKLLNTNRYSGGTKIPGTKYLILYNKASFTLYNMVDNTIAFRLDKPLAGSMSQIIKMLSDSVTRSSLRDIEGFTFSVSRNKKLLLLSLENKKDFKVFRANQLQQLGINQILNILADSAGNIFIQDVDKIICYNILRNRARTITPNYSLQDATMHTHHDKLVVVGSHGITVYKIGHLGNVTSRHTVINFKERDFTAIQSSTVNPEGQIMLATDSGFAFIPLDSIVEKNGGSGESKFKLLLKGPVVKQLIDGDTIAIEQTDAKMGIDAINFSGSGVLEFRYKTPGKPWQQSNSGEITLPGLQPGQYYPVTISAQDKQWHSKPVTIYIWQQPYWYQTKGWRALFWIAGILLFAGSLYLVSVVTRRKVAASSEQRRKQTELELRAIHSQINPHFIFNTLSTALYFMKTEKTKEAYEHVDKFSKLLRAYLRSSRERWTTLEEDLLILDQYIQLQRTRLQHGLSYSIDVDPQLNPKQVMIPSLLLQPLIENAIHHGLFNKGEEGKLSIRFKQDEEHELICTIEDNGIGREKAKALKLKQQDPRKSYGTEMTADLIQTFRKYEQMDIKVKYLDKHTPETGTVVIVSFKKIKRVSG